jgi:predicted phosphate transport protein (TIGR00153 family)
LSDLIKWFEKRKETKALADVQRHLVLTTGIVEDLENAIRAAVKRDQEETQNLIRRVATNEKEADALRRKVMDEISTGELSANDREDLMGLVKKVDMVADWSRESTRILTAIPMENVPETIRNAFVEMVQSVRQCAVYLQKCVNKIMTKPEEALQAADAVERQEERIDDLHEKARILLGKEDVPHAGVAVLISQLFEAIEMIADSCEDACDQVRVIMIRK